MLSCHMLLHLQLRKKARPHKNTLMYAGKPELKLKPCLKLQSESVSEREKVKNKDEKIKATKTIRLKCKESVKL